MSEIDVAELARALDVGGPLVLERCNLVNVGVRYYNERGELKMTLGDGAAAYVEVYRDRVVIKGLTLHAKKRDHTP